MKCSICFKPLPFDRTYLLWKTVRLILKFQSVRKDIQDFFFVLKDFYLINKIKDTPAFYISNVHSDDCPIPRFVHSNVCLCFTTLYNRIICILLLYFSFLIHLQLRSF